MEKWTSVCPWYEAASVDVEEEEEKLKIPIGLVGAGLAVAVLLFGGYAVGTDE